MNKKQLKTYAFIDASNIIYGASRYGWKMDFKKLSRYLKTRYLVQKIFYYAGTDHKNKKQLNFYKKIKEFGYILCLIPVKTFSDGSRKGDVDSKMTFEMMLHYQDYTNAIIMTGDGDYYWVLEYLLKEGKKVKLIAHSKSTAKELKQLFGEEFDDLSRMKEALEINKMR